MTLFDELLNVEPGDEILVRGDWLTVTRVTPKWILVCGDTHWSHGYSRLDGASAYKAPSFPAKISGFRKAKK